MLCKENVDGYIVKFIRISYWKIDFCIDFLIQNVGNSRFYSIPADTRLKNRLKGKLEGEGEMVWKVDIQKEFGDENTI